jgi:desumoylating isopeptidase 1
MSSNPILFGQFPPLATVLSKFTETVKGASAPESFNKEQLIITLSKSVLPYLTGLETFRSGKAKSITPAASPTMLSTWAQATQALATGLPTAQLFPLVDMWRLAMLDPAVTMWTSTILTSPFNPLYTVLTHVSDALSTSGAQTVARNTILVSLRLLANALGAPTLSIALCATHDARTRLLEVLVPSLLHDDDSVRTAAASVAFNVSACLQRRRVDRVKAGRNDAVKDNLDGDWEIELLSAVMEAIQRETKNEDVGKSHLRPAVWLYCSSYLQSTD